MTYQKIIPGKAVQIFDEDGFCIEQHFIGDGEVKYKSMNGETIEPQAGTFLPKMRKVEVFLQKLNRL